MRGSVSVSRAQASLPAGTARVSQVPDASRHASRALRWTPADPRDAHQTASSVWASGALTPSPSAFSLLTGLYQAWGSAVSPTGYVVPCVCFNCLVRLYISASSTVATLGMSGWLDLTQQGLSPCKKRQASLGALTPGAHWPWPKRDFSSSSRTATGPGSSAAPLLRLSKKACLQGHIVICRFVFPLDCSGRSLTATSSL